MTVKEYLTSTPEGHFELIYGQVCEPPSPEYGHQDSSAGLFVLMRLFAKLHNKGVVLSAPMDVILDEEKNLIVQPDILYISNKRKHIIKKRIYGAPDLVAEVISQGSQRYDTIDKKAIYEKYGVREYWIVNPVEKSIRVFTLDNGKYKLAQSAKGNDIAKSLVLDGFEVKLKEIF